MNERMGVAPRLAVRKVHAAYGPYRALFDVSLHVGAGEVVALLGANGAGKTTIARVVSGLLAPTRGAVFLDGESIGGERPYRIARMGVAHVPEGRSVFSSLTVEENLTLAFRQQLAAREVSSALDEAYVVFPRLRERRAQPAGTLSGGEQRMLALARVLVRPPKVLVADEPSLGLAPVVVADVYRTLDRIRSDGTALLLIEQHVHQAATIADRVVVLKRGRVTFEGPVSALDDSVLTEAIGDQVASGDSPSGSSEPTPPAEDADPFS